MTVIPDRLPGVRPLGRPDAPKMTSARRGPRFSPACWMLAKKVSVAERPGPRPEPDALPARVIAAVAVAAQAEKALASLRARIWRSAVSVAVKASSCRWWDLTWNWVGSAGSAGGGVGPAMTGAAGAEPEPNTVPELETTCSCSPVLAEPATSAATAAWSARGWTVTIARAAGGLAGADIAGGSPPGLQPTTVTTRVVIRASIFAAVIFTCSSSVERHHPR